MKIKDITQHIESIAPLSYQESYDNAGLIVGDAHAECTNALLCLDSTEAVIDEAIEKGCNLVIAHHPIIFGGLKKITGRNYVEKTILKAIKNDIAIYAAHTNLDNVHIGVNRKICDKIGLTNCRILAPKRQILKHLQVLCPLEHAATLRAAMWDAGAGQVMDYDSSSFNVLGTGTQAIEEAKQYGFLNISVHFPIHLERAIVSALLKAHPAAKPTYSITQLDNTQSHIGSGMIGNLPEAMNASNFLNHLKKAMKADCVRHTRLLKRKVRTVAVCGGVGSFLLPVAVGQQADVFVTADYKYHEFFDANDRIIIADVGHYESEQFTVELFYEILTKKFSNFVPILSKVNTNPIKYL